MLAALLALSGALASWASSLADSERFADLATEALVQEDVSQLVAERLVDRFASDTAIGTSGRPFAVGVTEDIISSDEFAGVFNAAVRTAHEQLVSDRDDSVTVALAGAAPLLDPALDPDDTSDPPSDAEAVVAVVDDPDLVRISHVLSVMDTVALLCAVGWLVLSAVVLVIASDRRRALRRLGSGLLVTGVVLITGVVTARALVGRGEPADAHAAAAALVSVFTGPLLLLAEVLAVVGAIVAMCALSTPPTVRQLAEVTAERATAAWRQPVVRAVAPVLVLAVGLAFLLIPEESITALTQLVGIALIVVGSVVLLGWFGRLLDRGRARSELPGAVSTLRTSALSAVVVAAVVAALTAGALAPRDDGEALPVRRSRRSGMQRTRRAVRPSARRGGACRHAQLDVVERRGRLVPRRAAPDHQRTAGCRRTQPDARRLSRLCR